MSGIITCSFLANQRVGNACFTYMFAKAYARLVEAELQTPADWVGRKIFANATEPVISINLPRTEMDSTLRKPPLYFLGQINIDVAGYFQNQASINLYSRAKAHEWLRLKPEFEQYAPHFSYPYSAAHLRKGDYVNNPTLRKLYCEVSDESYHRAIQQFNIPDPLYFIYDGRKAAPQELIEQKLEWIPDFLMLRDAAHLLRANSTFSVWASWLGNGKTYSPVVGDKVGLQTVQFAEGNHSNTAGKFQNQSDLHLKE